MNNLTDLRMIYIKVLEGLYDSEYSMDKIVEGTEETNITQDISEEQKAIASNSKLWV